MVHGVSEDGVRWGIAPEDRRNRRSVDLMLAFARDRRFPLRLRPLRRAAHRGYRAVGRLLELLHGSEIDAKQIGDDLYLPHPWGIVVHSEARIGAGCTIYQNVTIGETATGPGVPTIGDRVIIGAGAAVLGPVTVGDDAVIGANAVIVSDVAPGTTTVGPRARIVSGDEGQSPPA